MCVLAVALLFGDGGGGGDSDGDARVGGGGGGWRGRVRAMTRDDAHMGLARDCTTNDDKQGSNRAISPHSPPNS